MRILIAMAAVAVLAGCATNPTPPPAIVYKEKDVPVSVGCVVGRPAPVIPLNKTVDAAHWAALAPGAKAEAVHAQAGRRLNYEDKLSASAAACPDAPPGAPTPAAPVPGSTPAAT